LKIHERLGKIEELQTIELTYVVKCVFGEEIRLFGNNIVFTESSDFARLEDSRIALEWLVDQLGGSVKWGKK
jgi:hypothetical protein